MKKNKCLLKVGQKYFKTWKLFCLMCCLNPSGTLYANLDSKIVSVEQQEILLKGKVVDINGEAVIGASVVTKGGKRGVITDINGDFSLSIFPKTQIVISFIGYATQIVTPKSESPLKVVLLEDSKMLDEVVVTVGYGTQRMKNVTGSIATVSGKDLENLPVSTLAEALDGQIPGLNVSGGSSRPGENATVSIRQNFGFSKDGSSSLPLIIIDDVIQVDPGTGHPTMGLFNTLDASEVESITVLRDASAAIYGSRASQGAIIVKTKRGHSGKPRISYSGKFELNDAVGHSKTMSAHEYGIFANSFLRAKGTTQAGLFSDEELEKMKSLNYDWMDNAWSSAFAMNHSLNISGGSDNITYFAGASYYDQGANMGTQDYSKWSFRAGVDAKLISNLKLSVSISANESLKEKSFNKSVSGISDGSYGSKANGTEADYGYLLHIPKYIPWSQEVDGEEYWVSPAFGPHGIAGNQTTRNSMSSWNYYALLNNGSKSISDNFGFSANFSLQYDIPFIKGLSVRGSYARSRSASDGEQIQLPYTLALAKNTNGAGTHLYSDKTIWNVTENNNQSRVAYSDNINESTQMNFYLNYSGKFGDHNISAMASIERSESSYKEKSYLYDGPEAEMYLGTSASAGALNASNSYTKRGESGSMSYLGRLNYSYADRYLLQFMFRVDASTKFSPENYWGFFPTVSLGWVASEERWFKNSITWIDFLKFRGSVGKTGKDNVSAWKWLQIYTHGENKGLGFGTEGGTHVAGVNPNASPNRDLHWDTSIKYNFGVDARFFNGRLGVGWDAYFDRHKDMLTNLTGAVGVPIAIGGAFAEQNYSAVDAYGTELSLNWNDKIGKLGYNIGINFGFSDNRFRKIPPEADSYPSNNIKRVGHSSNFPLWGFRTWKGNTGGDGLLRTDADVDAYWDYLTERATSAGTKPNYLGITDKAQVKKGMLAYQDLHGAWNNKTGEFEQPDGKIVKEDDVDQLLKNEKRKGFNTKLGLNWRGISFSTQIATNWGGLAVVDNMKQDANGSKNILWAHESYLTDMYDEQYNVNGKYPNIAYYSQTGEQSEFWQVSSFRCYIKNLSIGYSLPVKWISGVGLNTVKLTFTGHNLWDFYNPYPKKYRNMYDNSFARYPTLRTWALGVSLAF